MHVLALLSLLFVLPFSAAHADIEQGDLLTMPDGQAVVYISATQRMEVEQDLLIANLRIEKESSNAAEVQNSINTQMKDALDRAKKYKTIKVQTSQYSINKRTLPRTNVEVWNGSQGLIVRSTDADSVLDYVGKLQDEGFLVSGLSYTLSPELAAQYQDEMMEDALDKLETRATRAAKALGKSKAELIEIRVSPEHIPSTRYNNNGYAKGMMMESVAMAAPVAASGETTLTITVSATAKITP